YFALVPAAGAGSRLGSETPKQYLPLAGHPVLYHTLRQLAGHPQIEQVFVVLAPADAEFRLSSWGDLEAKVQPLYCGGETRAASVYNGLLAARNIIGGDDWVLVHDAARPCLSADALARLIVEVGNDEAGGLLAIPVADTLKRGNGDGRVTATERREGLWQAQTPQMFRYGFLIEALRRCGPATITDEASAIESMGLKPKLVMGEARNLKITYAQDLHLASLILQGSVKA
ncbi:MAG TPA: 2-C-methyl-D-erythritol 4-phosphate cytidylyltransferase, partial [Burkholderiales bacterium]|nr:2-C-methyl-D-erythritol 4-phosphate cytidylyltransferase [Burkholderiales bacterium]